MDNEALSKLKGGDIYINPNDDSTTVLARATECCGGHHQTIAGALLGSKEWGAWYEYASKNMLYDVDETQELGDMGDKHFNAFIEFVKNNIK